MADQLEQFLTAQREFGARVHAVAEDQWQAGTPCHEWSVADLVTHLVDEHRWAAPLLHGQDIETAGKIVQGSRSLPVDGGIGANLAEEWDEAAVGSADAFSADGALERTVTLSYGERPVSEYLGQLTFDLTLHAWDLGQAIGYAAPLPDDLVEAAWTSVADMGDAFAASEMFGERIPVPDEAPTLHRLLGFTGRNPG
jgi:uncharacterized protein (TIGR03086 family)